GPGFSRPAKYIGGGRDVLDREPQPFQQRQLARRPAARVLSAELLPQLGLHVVILDRPLLHRDQQVAGFRERRLPSVNEQPGRRHGGGVDLTRGWDRCSNRVDVVDFLQPTTMVAWFRARGDGGYDVGSANGGLGTRFRLQLAFHSRNLL